MRYVLYLYLRHIILNSAVTQFGNVLLSSLLTFESQVIEKANDALKDVQKFLVAAATGFSSQAVIRLAQFAVDIITALNQLVGQSVFANLACVNGPLSAVAISRLHSARSRSEKLRWTWQGG
jgi:hypothetical protein